MSAIHHVQAEARTPSESEETGRPEEGGFLNIGLLGAALAATLFVLLGVMNLAVASNAAQENQNAADAAALAGAEAFAAAGQSYFAPGFSTTGELRDKVKVTGACPAQVRAAATSFASRNGATLASCRMLEWGEVEVSTRMDVPVEDAPDGMARARAHWSLDWTTCYVDPAFVAPVTGSAYTWMQCGDERFDLKYAAGRFFLHPWGQVKQAIEHEVRLVD